MVGPPRIPLADAGASSARRQADDRGGRGGAVCAIGRARFDLRVLVTAPMALDIGLSIQRFVDPERVGLDMWPEAFDALYAGVEDPG